MSEYKPWREYLRRPDEPHPEFDVGGPLGNTNWPLLYEMKLVVIRNQVLAEEKDREKEAELLSGLINFLDRLQDYAEEELGIPRELVFTIFNTDHPSNEENPRYKRPFDDRYVWPLEEDEEPFDPIKDAIEEMRETDRIEKLCPQEDEDE